MSSLALVWLWWSLYLWLETSRTEKAAVYKLEVLLWFWLYIQNVINFSPSYVQQHILQYLKDMFDHDKVRFTSAQCLAEDILNLSHRRSEILLGYLGINGLLELNGAPPRDTEGPSEPNWGYSGHQGASDFLGLWWHHGDFLKTPEESAPITGGPGRRHYYFTRMESENERLHCNLPFLGLVEYHSLHNRVKRIGVWEMCVCKFILKGGKDIGEEPS